MNSIKETNFNLPNQTKFYKGKVRDVYTIGKDKLGSTSTNNNSILFHNYDHLNFC